MPLNSVNALSTPLSWVISTYMTYQLSYERKHICDMSLLRIDVPAEARRPAGARSHRHASSGKAIDSTYGYPERGGKADVFGLKMETYIAEERVCLWNCR